MKTHWLIVACILTIPVVGSSQLTPKSRPAQVTVSGTSAQTLKGAPVTLLTVRSSHRLSRTKVKVASVCHALIFHPGARILSIGGGFSNEGSGSPVTINWILQKTPNDYKNTDEKELVITNDLAKKTLTVGDKNFSLSKGNLLIIRLDENWLPASTQVIEKLIDTIDDNAVLDAFKKTLPGDEVIQKLEFELPPAFRAGHVPLKLVGQGKVHNATARDHDPDGDTVLVR